MRPDEKFRRRSLERDLAAFAGGSLAGERVRRLERVIAGSPELRARLLEQQRALAVVGIAHGEQAPPALRARLAPAPTRRSRARLARAPTRRSRTRLAPAPTRCSRTRLRSLWPAVVSVVSALVLALVLIGEGGAGMTVAAAAALATRPPVSAVQDPRDGQVTLPGVRVAGLSFPYWEDGFGWHAVGLRRDALGGRAVTTVFYRRDGHLIGYTIVPGPPLTLGSRAQSTVRNDTVLHTFSVDGRLVVTWQRREHTCVLSGPRVAAATLLRLATWRAGGRLPF